MPDIKIPEAEIANLLSAQILSQLSQETQKNLIQAALQYLLVQPMTGRYGEKGDSPIQTAFNMAMNRVANTIAEECIAEAGVKDSVKELFMQLINDIPDVRYDWDLQRALFKAMLDHAEEKTKKERGY